MGLHESFSNVRSNILMREPLPNVKSAFAICSREESYKAGTSSGSNSKNPNSAFFSKVNDNKKWFSSNNNKSPLVCKNCGLKGHTIERCYKLIGFPKDFKGKSDSSFQNNKNVSNNCQQSEIKPDSQKADNDVTNNNSLFSNNSSFSFSPDQVSKLLSLINEKKYFQSSCQYGRCESFCCS